MRDEIEIALHRLAPELETRPYVLWASELGADRPDTTCYYGTTREDFSAIYRDSIGERWRGGAPAMLLDDKAIAKAAKARGMMIEQFAIDIAIHELGHVLQLPWPHHEPRFAKFAPELLAEDRASVGAEIVAGLECEERQREPWYQHAADFHRIVGHLIVRAGMLGVPCNPKIILPNGQYTLGAGIGDYLAALADEARIMRHRAFTEIKQRAPPERFVRLWNRDTKRTIYFIQTERERTMIATIERIRQAKTLSDAEKAREYLQLVRDTAAGNEVDPDAAAAILDATGKTVDELDADAAKQSKRLQLHAKLAEMPALAAKREALEAKIGAAQQVLAKAREEHDRVCRPALAELNGVKQTLASKRQICNELLQTCPDAALVAEYRAAVDALNEAHARLRKVREQAAAARTAAFSNKQAAGDLPRVLTSAGWTGDESKASLLATAQRQTDLAEQLEAQATTIEAEIAERAATVAAARAAVEAA
ncbi:MAG: hypothetical protein DCC68_21260 [Planctomycetota bacterium]|nr:MAG: hypothetical protein DCC68_21260 [Planctomycetota bacterium]